MPNAFSPSHFNRFVYVNNSPLIYTDPTGHCSYAGENDSCDYLEEGSNAGMGHLEEYAQVRIAAEDARLTAYERILADYFKKKQELIQGYNGAVKSRRIDYGDTRSTKSRIKAAAKLARAEIDSLMDPAGFEAFVSSKQGELQGDDIGHPMDDPVDPSKWSIQPDGASQGTGGTSLLQKVVGGVAIFNGGRLAIQGSSTIVAGVVTLVPTGGASAATIGLGVLELGLAYELVANGLCYGYGYTCDVPGVPPFVNPVQ